MRRVGESPALLRDISVGTGSDPTSVARVVAALRDAIDGLFLDGFTIFAPPFSLTYPDDPVSSIFAERVASATERELEAWYLGDMEAIASWLGIPLVTYLRHPVASELHVLAALFECLGIDDADGEDGSEAAAIARAWFDSFSDERTYRLSTVGLERDLEEWLVHNAEKLGQIGYDVTLRHQQFVLPDRRRPDLVFNLLGEGPTTGTLIVELKATEGYVEAVDQLVGYMDAFSSLGLANGILRGLLVADGFPAAVLDYADLNSVDTATLTELGYRRDLAGVTTKTAPTQNSGAEPEIIMNSSETYVPWQNGPGVEAMQAAADFVRAAWDVRKNITYLPPRGLAEWLRDVPHELRGDDDLPEHIQIAADALEGLAAAILEGKAPGYYEGDASRFLADAERTFRNVANRLRRITPLYLEQGQ